MDSQNSLDKDSSKIETLDAQKNIQDIPTSTFRPISDVAHQQEALLENYEEQHRAKEGLQIPDLSDDVKRLEKKLEAKKYTISIPIVIGIVLIINLCWFLGVKFLIVPKYEEYVKQSDEIKANYDDLKSKVDAIVGEWFANTLLYLYNGICNTFLSKM